MATYKAPGVYIEEVQLPPGIVGVGTSTAGFVGYCETKSDQLEAQLVTSFTEFRTIYGDFIPVAQEGDIPESYLAYSVYAFFQQGGTLCYVVNTNADFVVDDGTSKSDSAEEKAKEKEKSAEEKEKEKEEPEATEASVVLQKKATFTAKEPGEAGNDITVGISVRSIKFWLLVNGEKVGESATTISDLADSVNKVEASLVTMSYEDKNKSGKLEKGTSNLEGGTGDAHTDTNEKVGNKSSEETSNTSKNDSGPLKWATLKAGLSKYEVVNDVNLIVIPDLCLLKKDEVKTALKDLSMFCEKTKDDCFFIADIPQSDPDYNTPTQLATFVDTNDLTDYRGFGAIYYPYIQIANPAYYFPTADGKPAKAAKQLFIPPSGAIAGTYAATDAKVGVYKAPAGIRDGRLGIALKEEVKVTEIQLGLLNVGGINNLKSFPGTGVCIWGARTTALETSAYAQWKYVNVRRLFLFVEQSIKQSSRWVVFEPNSDKLWGIIIRNVTAFLTSLWREGALFGESAEEAFFVKVDAENNPPASRNAGQLIIEIGIAPVFPAEFVIIRIGQKTAPGA
ncbi:MAG: phage tail sheath C-terminal domain-containing protein [Colwellia sp.]|jgi:Phage tail sheath protein FI